MLFRYMNFVFLHIVNGCTAYTLYIYTYKSNFAKALPSKYAYVLGQAANSVWNSIASMSS